MKTPFFNSDERIVRLLANCALWLDTPFHPQGKLLGIGVDCVQLVGGIYVACGVLPHFRPPHYTMDGGKHNAVSQVVEYVEASKRFEPVPMGEQVVGDLLCFRKGKVSHHVAIHLGGTAIIHSVERYGTRIHTLEDPTVGKRFCAVYRPLEV